MFFPFAQTHVHFAQTHSQVRRRVPLGGGVKKNKTLRVLRLVNSCMPRYKTKMDFSKIQGKVAELGKMQVLLLDEISMIDILAWPTA